MGMAASVKVFENVSAFVRSFERALPVQAVAVRRKVGETVRRNIQNEIRSWGGKSTGRLARSFRTVYKKVPGGYTYEFVSNLPYARIHETGGVVRPRGKWKLGGKNRLAVGFRTGGAPKAATSVKVPRSRYLTKASRKALPQVNRIVAASVRLAVRTSAQVRR